MKKREIVLILSLCTMLIFVSACTSEASPKLSNSSDVATLSPDGYQELTLTYGKIGTGYWYNYILSPSVVQVNVPVRITGDVSRLNGCYRTVTIPDLGVRKTLSSGDNTIIFTPTKTGDFTVACSMGMATTTLTVE